MATGMRTIDLRWGDAQNRFVKALPGLLERNGNHISEREKEILNLFIEGKTGEQIGKIVLNPLTGNPVSRARIHQIAHRAVRKLLAPQQERFMREGLSAEDALARAEDEAFG